MQFVAVRRNVFDLRIPDHRVFEMQPMDTGTSRLYKHSVQIYMLKQPHQWFQSDMKR